MNSSVPRLLVDCSVVVKWKLLTEPFAAEANELQLDWEHGEVVVCASDQLFVELASAFLRATRQHPPRLSLPEARTLLEDLLVLPFSVYRTRSKPVLTRALGIASQYNQRVYDCIYIALAERRHLEFWTGDERLYNALHADLPFVRWIAHYQRRRPGP